MAFQVAALVKLAPLLGKAKAVVARWRALPSEQRKVLAADAKEIVGLLGPLTAAVKGRGDLQGPRSWSEAVELAVNPPHEVRMAEAIVDSLRRESLKTPDELAAEIGAAGDDDSAFGAAVKLASADGLITRAGISLRGIKWDITEWADGELLDGEHILELESAIRDSVQSVKLATDETLAASLGLEADAPEFRAALERAVASAKVQWFGYGIYGVTPEELPASPPDGEDEFAARADTEDAANLDALVDQLKGKVVAFGSALTSAEGRDQSVPTARVAPDASASIADRLREAKRLHDDGLLTEEEFAEKRRVLLEQL